MVPAFTIVLDDADAAGVHGMALTLVVGDDQAGREIGDDAAADQREAIPGAPEVALDGARVHYGGDRPAPGQDARTGRVDVRALPDDQAVHLVGDRAAVQESTP